jgi:hypothetical protein
MIISPTDVTKVRKQWYKEKQLLLMEKRMRDSCMTSGPTSLRPYRIPSSDLLFLSFPVHSAVQYEDHAIEQNKPDKKPAERWSQTASSHTPWKSMTVLPLVVSAGLSPSKHHTHGSDFHAIIT